MVCCFVGHRTIDNAHLLEDKVHSLVRSLIEKGIDKFLFGSKSQFNDLCYKVVSNEQTRYPHIKRIAYTCASESCTLLTDRELWEKLYKKLGKKKCLFLLLKKKCVLIAFKQDEQAI